MGATYLEFETRLRAMGLYNDAKRVVQARGATLEEVYRKCRERHIAAARIDLVMFFIDKGWSKSAIGRLLGRGASTVSKVVSRRKSREKK